MRFAGVTRKSRITRSGCDLSNSPTASRSRTKFVIGNGHLTVSDYDDLVAALAPVEVRRTGKPWASHALKRTPMRRTTAGCVHSGVRFVLALWREVSLLQPRATAPGSRKPNALGRPLQPPSSGSLVHPIFGPRWSENRGPLQSSTSGETVERLLMKLTVKQTDRLAVARSDLHRPSPASIRAAPFVPCLEHPRRFLVPPRTP